MKERKAVETLTPVDPFRREAEETAAKMERLRLEHIAQERGVTVAQLSVAPAHAETETPRRKAVTRVLEAVEHVRESVRKHG